MERDLNEREKAGVPDAVLLEDYTNEDVFLENLEKRFRENIIYVRTNFCVQSESQRDVTTRFFVCCRKKCKFWSEHYLVDRLTSVRCWFLWIPTRNCRSTRKKTSRPTERNTFSRCHLMCKSWRSLTIDFSVNSRELHNFDDFLSNSWYYRSKYILLFATWACWNNKHKKRTKRAIWSCMWWSNNEFFPPNRFALSDNAFRLLIEENRSQCILISGECIYTSVIELNEKHWM